MLELEGSMDVDLRYLGRGVDYIQRGLGGLKVWESLTQRWYVKSLRTWNKRMGTWRKARNTYAFTGQYRGINKENWGKPVRKRTIMIEVTDSKIRKRRRKPSVKFHDSMWSCESRTERHSVFARKVSPGCWGKHSELIRCRGSGNKNHDRRWLFRLWVQKPRWAGIQRSLGRDVLRDEKKYYLVKFRIFFLMIWPATSEADCLIPNSKDCHYTF